MSFTVPILLWGLIAAPLPWLLQRFQRQAPVPLSWGAFPILEIAVRKTRYRQRLDDFLLLFIRTVLIGLLTFAFAGPQMRYMSPSRASRTERVTREIVRPKILLLDGRESAFGDDRTCADFLTLALDGWEVERARASDWVDTFHAHLEKFDIVILADLAFPTARESALLHSYSQSGRGLFLVLGERTDAQKWNEHFFGVPLLDRIHTRHGSRGSPHDSRSHEPLNPCHYRHPIITPFADHPNAGLLSMPVERYVPVRTDRDIETILALPNGFPLIAAWNGPIGKTRSTMTDSSAPACGNVLIWTTAPQQSMSRWMIRPAFIPLVRESVKFAARRTVPENTALRTAAPGTVEGVFSLGPWLLLAATGLFMAEGILSGRRLKNTI